MSLLRTAARVGVATSVHGRVRGRQAERWAQANQAAQQPPAAAQPPQQPDPVPAAVDDAMSRKLAQLTQLGELKAAGILTDAEFEAKKTLILAG